jgi:hypothetical protein
MESFGHDLVDADEIEGIVEIENERADLNAFDNRREGITLRGRKLLRVPGKKRDEWLVRLQRTDRRSEKMIGNDHTFIIE